MAKQPKPKKCRHCGTLFTPRSTTQVVCQTFCAIEYGKKKKQERAAKDHRIAKKEFRLSDRPLQLKLTQAVVNKFIRLRDASEPCISCGRHHQGQYHAGHYLSVGSHPHLRFNTRNIFKQCSACNNHKSGNVLEYRRRLVERFGAEYVDRLEADKTPRKFTLEEIVTIGRYYKGMCKEIDQC